MDNHIINNAKNLPSWYIKILKLSRELLIYNNFFNNKEYKLCRIINPDYGFYSLKRPGDIFKIHPDLTNYYDLLIVEYDNVNNFMNVFSNNKDNLIPFKKYKIYNNTNDTNLMKFIDDVLTNDSDIILSEKIITGLFRYLSSGELKYKFLSDKYNSMNPKYILKNYANVSNFKYLYSILNNLKLKNVNVNYIPKSIPEIPNIQKITEKKLEKFIQGKTLSKKNLIIYHSIILSTLIGRFGKKTNLNKVPFIIEFIIDTYIDSLNINLRDDLNLMIRMFEKYRLLLTDNNKKFFITIDYEANLLRLFTNKTYWWNINKITPNNIDVSDNIDGMSKSIYKKFKNISIKLKNSNKNIYIYKKKKKDKHVIPVCCHSGCDNTFIEKNKNLFFIRTLSWIFCSSMFKTATNKYKLVADFYRNVSIDLGIKVDLVAQNNQHSLIINDGTPIMLTQIYSYMSIIENYVSYDNYSIYFNSNDYKLTLLEHMKMDIIQFLLFAMDCKNNNYLIWTNDIYMKLVALMYGCNLIFENLFEGSRILQLYSSGKSIAPNN